MNDTSMTAVVWSLGQFLGMRDAFEAALHTCNDSRGNTGFSLSTVVPMMLGITSPDRMIRGNHFRSYEEFRWDPTVVHYTACVPGFSLPLHPRHDACYRVSGANKAEEVVVIHVADSSPKNESMATIVVTRDTLTTEALGFEIATKHKVDLLEKFLGGYRLGRAYAANRAAGHVLMSSWLQKMGDTRTYTDLVRDRVSYESTLKTEMEKDVMLAYFTMWVSEVDDVHVVDVIPTAPVSLVWIEDALVHSRNAATRLFDERVRSMIARCVRNPD